MLWAMDRHTKDIAVTKLPGCPQLTRVTASMLENTTNNLTRETTSVLANTTNNLDRTRT